MAEIKCLDGICNIPKELLDKSERLKGPGGLTPGITKYKMLCLLEAANLDPLLRVPLPPDIPSELLYSFFPHMIPDEPPPDQDELTKELYRKMRAVRSIIKSFNVGSCKSCFVTREQIEKRAIVREKFLEEINKIPGGSAIEKCFRTFNKMNQATLIRFEETHHVISKLYEDFLSEIPKEQQSGPTLKQI